MLAGMNITHDNSVLRNPAAAEIPALLAELKKSGLSVSAFARARGLKPQQLYVARRRRKRKKVPAPVFDPVRIIGATEAPVLFQLKLASGLKLTIPTDFDSSALRRLLKILGAC